MKQNQSEHRQEGIVCYFEKKKTIENANDGNTRANKDTTSKSDGRTNRKRRRERKIITGDDVQFAIQIG